MVFVPFDYFNTVFVRLLLNFSLLVVYTFLALFVGRNSAITNRKFLFSFTHCSMLLCSFFVCSVSSSFIINSKRGKNRSFDTGLIEPSVLFFFLKFDLLFLATILISITAIAKIVCGSIKTLNNKISKPLTTELFYLRKPPFFNI